MKCIKCGEIIEGKVYKSITNPDEEHNNLVDPRDRKYCEKCFKN